MRHRLFAIAFSWLALVPAGAGAQVFGQFTGAEPVPYNGRLLGLYLVSSDEVLGLLGQMRMSLYSGIDFGFQGGVSRLSLPAGDRTSVRFGTDIKGAVRRPDASFPLAVAIGGAIGVETSDELSLLTLGPQVLVSRTFTMSSGSAVTPYGGLLIAFNRIDVDGSDHSDVSFPIRIGGDLQVSSAMRLMIEFQLTAGNDVTDDFQFSAGAHFPF